MSDNQNLNTPSAWDSATEIAVPDEQLPAKMYPSQVKDIEWLRKAETDSLHEVLLCYRDLLDNAELDALNEPELELRCERARHAIAKATGN